MERERRPHYYEDSPLHKTSAKGFAHFFWGASKLHNLISIEICVCSVDEIFIIISILSIYGLVFSQVYVRFEMKRGLSASESWENRCCRCESDGKETPYPGKRACHVTCGPCLYPDNPKCASCEIVGHCRLALDYLKSINPEARKGCYFEEQLSGEETLYHTLDFVNAQQHLVNTLGERKYLTTLDEANSRKAKPFTEMKNLVQVLRKPSISPEKAKELLERAKARNRILVELINRGPSTIGELSKPTGMEKSKLLRHLTAMRQDGKIAVVSERDNQPVYDSL
jgi:DNA-binding transcriptional ArsR family regulator